MPLYAFIIYYYISFLFYHLLLALAYYFIAIILYLAYLMQKVSYIYFTYHTRAGVRVVRVFLGRFSDFWGVLGGRVRQTVVLWIVGGRSGRIACAFVRVFPCVRACGGMPPPFFARAQSLGVYPLIVFGGYIGENEW